MKILFDTQVFDWQINGGISRYFIELFKRLDKQNDLELLFNCTHSYNTYLKGTKWLSNPPVLNKLHFKGKLSIVKKFNQKLNRRFSNRCLKKGEADIFHPTYYDPYFLDYLGKTPFVLTVHDLTNEKFPDKSSLTQKMLGWKRQLIRKADHIIAVSGNTKKDVIEYYQVSPEKITIAYLASPFYTDPVIDVVNTASPTSPYILFVGSRSGYKNFNGFITEISPVLITMGLKLVVAGGGILNASEVSMLKKNRIYDHVIALPSISDNRLQSLYKNALIFIFPSLYEGFGIPVLEAMQFGCPVLASDNSSLPEVGGNAALYFNPFEPLQLREKLSWLLAEEDQRSKMSKSGMEQVKKFNWDKTAEKHIEAYYKILNK